MLRDAIDTVSTDPTIATRWGTPLIGFADARDEGFQKLKNELIPGHLLPEEILQRPTVVISYFLPFLPETTDSNRGEGLASFDWARAYEETNSLLGKIGLLLVERLQQAGFHAELPEAASHFDRERLVSAWSQRHIAVMAGLGTFGLNNMLLTDAGCSGRLGSVVTDAPFAPDTPLQQERCLFKKNGSCGKCADACPAGALLRTGYDRQKCFAQCLKNAERYTDLGSSYAGNSAGSEVCGKCIAGMPCAHWKQRRA